MNKKEIEQEKLRREKLRDANNLEDISITEKIDIMKNVIYLEGLSNKQDSKNGRIVLKNKKSQRRIIGNINSDLRIKKTEKYNEGRNMLKQALTTTEILSINDLTVEKAIYRKDNLLFQSIKASDKNKHEIQARLNLLDALTSRLNDLKTATLCIPNGYENAIQRMKIFENLVEEAQQKNQTIKILSYIYKKVNLELSEELTNIPEKLEKLDITINANLKRIPVLQRMKSIANKDIILDTLEQERMEQDGRKQKTIRDELFAVRNKQLEFMRIAKYNDDRLEKKGKNINSQSAKSTRKKKVVNCGSMTKTIQKLADINKQSNETDTKDIIRKLLFKDGMLSLISGAAQVSDIEQIRDKYLKMETMEKSLLTKINASSKVVKCLEEEKQRLLSQLECETYRDRFGIRARQIKVANSPTKPTKYDLILERESQERSIHCLTQELFDIRQSVNLMLHKISEFVGSKIDDLDYNSINESTEILKEKCLIISSMSEAEGNKNIEELIKCDDKFGHRLDEFEHIVDCISQNGNVFVDINENEQISIKEYEFDTPDDPNCWTRLRMKKEHEKFLQKNTHQKKANTKAIIMHFK